MRDEPFASFEEAWQRFQESDSVQLGREAQEDWAQGRAQLLAFAALVHDAGIRDAIASFTEKLHGLSCLDLYPADFWHVTLKLVGFQVVKRTRPDEVLRQDVGPMLYAAERALRSETPFEVEIGPVNAFPGAVFLEVHDGGRLKDMHQRLLATLKGCPRFPYEGDSYLPHLSLARYASCDGLPNLKQRLAALRAERLGYLPVRRIELLKVWLAGDYPEFDVVQPVVLGRQR